MEIEQLKTQVLDFLQSQPGYDKIKDDPLQVTYGDADGFFILVGDNLQSGIGGFGDTAEQAYEDFVDGWEHFKGVNWIEKNR